MYLISHETKRRTYRYRVRLGIRVLYGAESNFLFANADVRRRDDGSENTAPDVTEINVSVTGFLLKRVPERFLSKRSPISVSECHITSATWGLATNAD